MSGSWRTAKIGWWFWIPGVVVCSMGAAYLPRGQPFGGLLFLGVWFVSWFMWDTEGPLRWTIAAWALCIGLGFLVALYLDRTYPDWVDVLIDIKLFPPG